MRNTLRRLAGFMLLGSMAVLGLLLVTRSRAFGASAEQGSRGSEPDAGLQSIGRETPRKSVQGFFGAANAGSLSLAADYLDLRGIPPSSRAVRGSELARKLAFILERQPTLDLSDVSDEPEGDSTSKTPGELVIETIYAGEEPIPITLKREHFPDGVDRWLFDQKTVEHIPALDAAYGINKIGTRLPTSLTKPTFLGNELWQWLGLVLAALAAYGVGRLLAALSVRAVAPFGRRTATHVDDALAEAARRPLRMIFGSIVFAILLKPAQLTTAVEDGCLHLAWTLLVIGIAWLLLRALGVWMQVIDNRVAAKGYDALARRRARTQAALLRRVASVVIAVLAVSVILLQFDFVRNVGVSLLASAGVVGVVFGFAAQKSLSALVGGIQFSFAQPVRIGDQVVVEGDFGEIEAIHLTYVVLRVWDKRRLILPITYFLEKPIENWTHSTTDIVGTVFLKVGFTLPVEAVRAELRRACEADPLWDGQTCSLQTTDSDASTVTVRALVSASNATELWMLRCNVRERLLGFIRSYEEGRHLPQWRHVVVAAPGSVNIVPVPHVVR